MTTASLSGTGDERDAYEVARSFVDAIVWGEHVRVWELLSVEARDHVLRAAARKGLDAVAAERARQETWSQGEADAFLTALLHGLRVDLSGVDLDRILVNEHAARLADGSLRFDLESPSDLPASLTGGANWAAGAVVVEKHTTASPSLSESESESESVSVWRVNRLIPRPATRADS